jgi:hypothetical protein
MSGDFQAFIEQARQARRDQRPRDSRDWYQRAADVARRAGDPLALVHALRHLSEMNRELGALDRAVAAGDEGVRLCRATPGTTTLDLGNAVRVLALAHQALGQVVQAASHWTEARALYAQAGIDAGVAEADRHLAAIASATG